MICDMCKKDITHEYYSMGGNCPECGDNLCADELRVDYGE